MKHRYTAFLAATFLSAGYALASPPEPATPPGVPVPASPADVLAAGDPDTPFYVKATQAGLAEVDGAMMAQRRSKSPQIQEFASMVAKDHTAANAQLHELADKNQVVVPTTVNAAQAAKKAELATLSGDDFDRAYIEWQILAHKDSIERFRVESETGDDKDARQFAIDTLPTLRSHLTKLYALPLPPVQPGVPTTLPDASKP